MKPNDDADDLDAELEGLIRNARPALDPVVQNRLAYEAGMAAGLQQRQHKTVTSNNRRWWSIVSHATSALAAGWLVFAFVPPSTIAPQRQPTGQHGHADPSMMTRDESKWSSESGRNIPDDGILRPRTRPDRFVEFMSDRHVESTANDRNTEDTPILNPRSSIF